MSRYIDILGQSIAVPDPDSVAGLSGQFRATTVTIGDAKNQLAAIRSTQAQAVWAGQAAEAFTRKLGDLPGQLDQAWQSYNTVAGALSWYADGLRPVVAALTSLAYQAEEAEGVLQATTRAREQVIAQGHDPAATGWNTRLSEATAEVGSLGRRLSALVGELEYLSAQCVRQIKQAEHEGISNNLISDLDRYVVQDAGTIGGMALRGALTVADDLLVKPFTGLYHDTEAFLKDPSWEALGKCLDELGNVLALASLLIPGIGEVAAVAFLAATVSDLVAVGTHEKGASLGQAGWAALNGVLMGTGAIAGLGARADAGYLRSAFDEGDFAQMARLRDGDDPLVTKTALWNTGVRSFLRLDGFKPDLTGDGVMSTLRDDRYAITHRGAEDYTFSPAVVKLQHAAFTFDRLHEVAEVAQDQLMPKDQGP